MARPDAGSALHDLQSDPSSRKKFLKMTGAGGAGALATLVAACGGDDKKASTSSSPSSSSSSSSSSSKPGAASMKGDLAILNYALTLEHLEAAFYQQAAQSGKLKGAALRFGQQFGETEADHVQVLTATIKKLGGRPGPAPKAKFPLKSQTQILKLAASVENLGAAAYLGQAGKIQNKEVLAAALSIHSVEARHAAALNTLIGKNPTVDGSAFAKPASMKQVLAAVKPYLAS